MAKKGTRGRRTRVEGTIGTNDGVDLALLDEYISKVEDLDAEGRKLHAEYMNEKRGITDDRNAVIDRAKDDGIPTEILKTRVKEREYDRRKEALVDRLPPARQYVYRDVMARYAAIKDGRGDPGAFKLTAPPEELTEIERRYAGIREATPKEPEPAPSLAERTPEFADQ